ncbi:MAG: septum formation inhibitor Maf [Chromatiales bacterium]|nr:septum formation inhibitor Maf [Chromatiales bacterium]
MQNRILVLGSTSPYRRELLQRLGLTFETAAPKVDETRHPGEDANALVRRLSEAKARAVGETWPDALVIGSDQVAVLDGEILGKPGNRERAIAQLSAASGKRVRFLTGLCLLDSATGEAEVDVVPFDVVFRQLKPAHIETYVDREQPYNCAGSFKSEGLGIALFEALEGADPNALIGLPLIRLCRLLERHGLPVL